MGIKNSLRKSSLITLATILLNSSFIKSQDLEKKLYEENNYRMHYLEERVGGRDYGYKNLFVSNEIINEEDKVPYYKPLEISWWCKFDFQGGKLGIPNTPVKAVLNLCEFTFSIPYVPRLGIGTSVLDGDYGELESPSEQIDFFGDRADKEEPIGSAFPVYLVLPLYIQCASPQSERIFKTEEGNLMIYYDSVNRGGIWTYATMFTSFFVGGSSWGLPNLAEEVYGNKNPPVFGKDDYLNVGINLLFFNFGMGWGFEGGILMLESSKLKDSFYGSFNIGLGTAVPVRLK